MTTESNESERRASALLGDWFVSTPESEAMLAEEVEALRQNEKEQKVAYVHSRIPNFTVSEHSDLITALCDRIERAWDEGWQAGYDDYDQGTETPNPYRVTSPGSTDNQDADRG